MKIYITYDRYERDEWFNVYNVSTNKDDAVKHCLEKDLVNFISYGPDDCHSFQLQEVDMSKKEYDTFTKWVEEDSTPADNGSESSDLYKYLVELFDKTGVAGNTSVLISTDGCSDNVDIVHYYGKQKGLDTTDDDVYYDLEEELFNDEELYEKVLKDYIRDTY